MADAAEPFKLPSDRDLAKIGAEFQLNVAQARELELALRHAQEDLKGFFRNRIGRAQSAQIVDRLKSFRDKLGALIKTISSDVQSFNDTLPFDAREAIADGASAELILATTGREVLKDGKRLAYASHAAGLLHGASLLAEQLRRVKAPVDRFFDSYASDTGGRLPDYVRQRLIVALADAAPAILGRRATGATRGPFIRLVTEVINECGLDDTGVEKAVERVLKSRKIAAQGYPRK